MQLKTSRVEPVMVVLVKHRWVYRAFWLLVGIVWRSFWLAAGGGYHEGRYIWNVHGSKIICGLGCACLEIRGIVITLNGKGFRMS